MISILTQCKKIYGARELIRYLVHSQLKISFANKLLGFMWTIFDPLMMMGVYVLLVTVIFKRGGPQFPILLFCSLLSWKWFSSSVSNSIVAITGKAKLIQTVYFPKAALPLSAVLVGFVNYLFSLLALIPMLFIFDADLTLHVFWLPVLLVIQLLFTIGVCMLFACLGVYFYDLQNIVQYLLRIWFYLSPGLYSVKDMVPERLQPLYMLNPFAVFFVSYKNILVRGSSPTGYLVVTVVISVLTFVVGLYIFERKEAVFAKEL